MELENIRNEIKKVFNSQFPIACNGIKVNNIIYEKDLNELLEKSQRLLNECKNQNLTYCLSEWSKVCLFLNFHKSLQYDCDSELLRLFETARNPNDLHKNINVNRLKGSIGLLHDQFLCILWVMIITVDSKLLLFKININVPNFTGKLQKIHEICSQNTDSLKNTREIAQDPEKKSKWWKLRKSLDTELTRICNELNDDLFNGLSVRNLKIITYI